MAVDLAAYADAGVTDLVVDYAADALGDVVSDLKGFAELIGEFRG